MGWLNNIGLIFALQGYTCPDDAQPAANLEIVQPVDPPGAVTPLCFNCLTVEIGQARLLQTLLLRFHPN